MRLPCRPVLTMLIAVGFAFCGGGVQAASASADTPVGFGQNTSGGMNGEVVSVATPEQLQHALCHNFNAAGLCSDSSPRVIVVSGIIHFHGAMGETSGLGCRPYTNKKESLVLLNDSDKHCDGFEKTPISYDKAGKNPLLVGSNKTIVGADNKAAIEGRGLRLVGVRNVIIRNLTIQEINPSVVFAGDAITLDNVDNVWIDHNRFFMIGRQMISAGLGPVTHITVSWNDFDGRTPYGPSDNGDHYWNMLFESPDQSVTIANNWVHDFAGRAPIIKSEGVAQRIQVQIVNNYFQNGGGHALNAHESTNVLVEGNYYQNVNTPILKNAKPGEVGGVFALVEGATDSQQQLCQQVLGRPCGINLLEGKHYLPGFDQNELVLHAFSSIAAQWLVTPYETSQVPVLVQAQAGPMSIAIVENRSMAHGK